MNPALAPITPESRDDRTEAAKQRISHTPTPWQYEDPEPGDSSVGISSSGPAISADCVGCPDVIPICHLVDPAYLDRTIPRDSDWWPDNAMKSVGNAEANGKFIVLACNTHDTMLDSLRRIEEIADDFMDSHNMDNMAARRIRAIISLANSALAKVKEASHD